MQTFLDNQNSERLLLPKYQTEGLAINITEEEGGHFK